MNVITFNNLTDVFIIFVMHVLNDLTIPKHLLKSLISGRHKDDLKYGKPCDLPQVNDSVIHISVWLFYYLYHIMVELPLNKNNNSL